MYLLRYLARDNTVHYGYLEGENIGSLSGDLFGDFRRGHLPSVAVNPFAAQPL